jgi:hypothetical protein
MHRAGVGLIFVAAKQSPLQVKIPNEFDVWLPYSLELNFFLSRSILVFISDAIRDYPDSSRSGHPTPLWIIYPLGITGKRFELFHLQYQLVALKWGPLTWIFMTSPSNK